MEFLNSLTAGTGEEYIVLDVNTGDPMLLQTDDNPPHLQADINASVPLPLEVAAHHQHMKRFQFEDFKGRSTTFTINLHMRHCSNHMFKSIATGKLSTFSYLLNNHKTSISIGLILTFIMLFKQI